MRAPLITVSIVSHGHGEMVERLLTSLLNFPEVDSIILTLNIPEKLNIHSDPRIRVIQNISPKGFGANHNAAFSMCVDPFFCVMNPDISLSYNPFPVLIATFSDITVGLVAPLVKNLKGNIEDSARYFLTPLSLFLRVLFGKSDAYFLNEGGGSFFPDWVGGMFMLFDSNAYKQLNGFDEGYFLYVEDVDICRRVWSSGRHILINQNVSVIHSAQRASRKTLKHMLWHINSLLRYFIKF